MHLASRRLEFEPDQASRVAMGLSALVLSLGPLLVFFPLVSDSNADAYGRAARQFGDSTLLTSADGRTLAAPVAGTGREVELRTATVRPAETPRTRYDVLVTTCDGIRTLLGNPRAQCLRTFPTTTAPDLSGDFVARGSPNATFSFPSVDSSSGLARVLDGVVRSGAVALVPREALPRRSALAHKARGLLVYPEEGRLEEARTSLLGRTGLAAQTLGERYDMAALATRQYQMLGATSLALAVAIGALATGIAAFDRVQRQRLEWALLRVSGVPPRVAHRSLLYQTALPAVLGIGVACAVTCWTAWQLVGLLSIPYISTPWRELLLISGLGALIPTGVTSLVWRWSRDREPVPRLAD